MQNSGIEELLKQAMDLHQSGNVNDAEKIYQKVLKSKPNHADALHLLGVVHLQRGEYPEAIRLIHLALNEKPSPIYENNLAEAYRKNRQYPQAKLHLENALSAKPDYADALVNLGNLYWNLDDQDKAIEYYRKAIALDSSFPEAHANLGNVLRKKRDFATAIDHFKKAIALRPAYADAWNNLGLTYGDLGEQEKAMQAFKHAISLNEKHPEAWANLGGSLYLKKNYAKALDCVEKANLLFGDNAYVQTVLAMAGQEVGDFDVARKAYRQASRLEPPEKDFHHHLSMNLLFFANYDPELSAEEVYDEYRKWNDSSASGFLPEKLAYANARLPHKRLRVGYVSPDFNAHAVRFFLAPLLSKHNKKEIELFAYADVKKPDAVTDSYRSWVDHWVDTVGLTDDDLATRIRKDGIDILVDVAGHTNGNRLWVFARKPAPIQVSWLGFGYTTGLTAMDYFLGDKEFTPKGCDSLFSETIWRLPHTAFVYSPPDNTPKPSTLPAFDNGYVTFGSLSRVIRFNDRVVATWARILQKVPGSRLLLNNIPFGDESTREKYIARFEAHGISRDRLDLSFSQPHWESYLKMDIALDPFPHNAGTTTFEALWMGVPVLSKLDRPSVGRFGATILGSLGLSHWVAADEARYVQAAVRFAADLEGLATLRSELRDCMKRSPLMDEVAFARDVEDAYRKMWEKFCMDSPVPDIIAGATSSHEDDSPSSKVISFPEDLLQKRLKEAGLALKDGCLGEAESIYRDLMVKGVENHAIYANMGIIAKRRHDLPLARQYYEKSIALNPDHAIAHGNLARLLRELQDRPAAAASFRRASELDPDNADYWSMLSNILREMDDLDGAEEAARKALALAPDHVEANLNLGSVFRHRLMLDDAIAQYQKVLALDPRCADALSNLGSIYKDRAMFDEAIERYDQALTLMPGKDIFLANKLFCINYHPTMDAETIAAHFVNFGRQLTTRVGRPFTHASHDHAGNDRPIRLGWVSADFKLHVVRLFIQFLFECMDRSRFKLIAYSNVEGEDRMTGWFRERFDHWRDIQALTDRQAAQRIVDDEIDILIDLSGHTARNRLGVFALKPAPVQITWLGFGTTTGLEQIDYFLGDEQFTPPGCDDLFTEKVLRLPIPPFCFRPGENAPADPGPLPALKKGFVTFGCLSRTVRYNERVIATWAKLLHALPGARLRLDNKPFEDKETVALFRKRFEHHGISSDRLIFACSRPHWNAFFDIDIALDPFPHNAGTTTIEALWMGVPVLSLKERPPVGCFGASLLHAVGMDEWVASSEDDYVKLGIAASQNLARLQELRISLRDRVSTSSLRDETGFTRLFENMFIHIWKGYCEGRTARQISREFKGQWEKDSARPLVQAAVNQSRQGDIDGAIHHYRLALEKDCACFEAANNLAALLGQKGDLKGAIAAASQAVTARPQDALGHANIANLYYLSRQWAHAEGAARLATLLNPDYQRGWSIMGNALRQLGRVVESIAAYRKALETAGKDQKTPVACDLAGALKDLAYFDEAMALFEGISKDHPRRGLGDEIRLFVANYHPGLSDDDVAAIYRKWDETYAVPLKPSVLPALMDPERRRLRIGYVSGDYRHHAVRFFLEPLLAHHDRERFEVYAYSDVIAKDSWTERFSSYFDHWRDIRSVTDDKLAELVRSDEIDILVDLSGHTADNRLFVFARKPAPIQVTWLGFGYTTGLSAINYFFGDERLAPKGCDHLFRESVWRLPRPVFVYRPPEAGVPEPGQAPFHRNGGAVTFGCFSRSVRINDRVVDVWAKILRRVPGSSLLLNHRPFGDSLTAAEFRARFARKGIPPFRLKLGFHTPPWPVYREIDIALDPFPHNCGTTTFEALYMGVPVVSLRDRISVGRFGDTILSAIGLSEWVADDTKAYVDIAVALAGNKVMIDEMRTGLRGRLQDSPLMDEAGFTCSVEAAYREMWCIAGGKPFSGQIFIHDTSTAPSVAGGVSPVAHPAPSDTAGPPAKHESKQLETDQYYGPALSDIIQRHKAGEIVSVEADYRLFLKYHPDHYQASMNLGVLLNQTGRQKESVDWMEKALALKPDYAVGFSNLGTTLRDLGRVEEAMTAFQKAVDLKPDYAEAHNNLGVIHEDRLELDKAESHYRQATLYRKDYVTALNNLAHVLVLQGRIEAAETVARKVQKLAPHASEPDVILGKVRHDEGDLEKAFDCFSTALTKQGNSIHALLGAGSTLSRLKIFDKAMDAAQKVLELEPENREAHVLLVHNLRKLGRVNEAREACDKALSQHPEDPELIRLSGNTAVDYDDIDAGIELYEKSLMEDPKSAAAYHNLLFAANYHPNWPAERIFSLYRVWGEQCARPLMPVAASMPKVKKKGEGRRLRVGYVSGDFREHAASHFIFPLLSNHDREAFKIFAYSQVAREDETSRRFKGLVDVWRRTIGMDDEAFCNQIRTEEIDVLVDLSGHTAGNRLLVFARKPAPVQVSWLGYGYTTGLPTMDWFLGDHRFTPLGSEKLFSERIWRLPTAFCYHPPETALPVSLLPAHQKGTITFGTLTRSIRLNPRVLDVWSGILKALPMTRLMLNSKTFKEDATCRYFAEAFSKRGIAPDRLIMQYTKNWEGYRAIDIMLDPFPHNAGTTTFEALWMGVPVVTLKDRPSVGRFGAAILGALDMDDWVADDEKAYVTLAVEKARNLEALAALRMALRERMRTSPLCDGEGFTRNLESAYIRMVQMAAGETA